MSASKLLEKYVKSLIINREYPKNPENFVREYNYRNDQYNFENKDFVHIAIWFEENIDANRSLNSSEEWYGTGRREDEHENLTKRKQIIKLLFKIYSEEYPDLPKKNLTNIKKLLKNILYVAQSAIKKKENKKAMFYELFNGIIKILYSIKKKNKSQKGICPKKRRPKNNDCPNDISLQHIHKGKTTTNKNCCYKHKKGKTVKELKAECKRKGIKGYSKLRKNQLLALLN